jgi:hypothetical protein
VENERIYVIHSRQYGLQVGMQGQVAAAPGFELSAGATVAARTTRFVGEHQAATR